MSYILDALKKSEKERRRDAVPDMLTVQDITSEKPEKSFHWVYLLIAALILNAGILVWWFGFSQDRSRGNKTDALKPSENLSEQYSIDKVESPARKPLGTEPGIYSPEVDTRLSAGTVIDSSTKDPEIPAVGRKALSESVESTESDGKAPAILPGEVRKQGGTDRALPSRTDDLDSLDENRIYKFKEIPISIREDLPSLSISALMYSDQPGSRLVRVNDQMVREGQEVAAGISVEEITQDGVVFRRQKLRFWVGLK